MKEKKRKSAMTVYCQSFALYIYNGICSTETRIDKHLLIDLSIIREILDHNERSKIELIKNEMLCWLLHHKIIRVTIR